MFKKVGLFFLLATHFVNGQHIDTSKVGFVTFNNSAVQSLDTALTIKNYLEFNDYSKDDFGIISMGNQGDVRRRLSFDPIIVLGPNLGIDGYFKNYLRIGDVPFYNVNVPTGGLRFLQGYQKGQLFNGHFTVNPISRLNVYFDYSRINSKGNYFNQENTADHLHLSTRYSTKNNGYRVAGSISWNKYKNSEHGGVFDAADFESNRYSNQELVAINLGDSDTRLLALESVLDQSLRILELDSLIELRTFYTFSSTTQYLVFRSTDSVFTKNSIFLSSEVRDSTRIQSVNNVGGLSLLVGKNEFSAGIAHTYYKYGNLYSLQSENLLGMQLNAKGNISSIEYLLGFQNYFSGAYKGSYEFKANIDYTAKRASNLKLSAYASHGLYNAGLFSQQFVSNNFVWKNGFNKILQSKLAGAIFYKRYGIQADVRHVNNYIYFNKEAVPAQLESNLIAYKIDLKARVKIAKGLYLDNIVRFQGTDKEELVRIPDWVLRNILFYEMSAFKNALNLHVGVEFNYFSSFASEAYMPATTIMYLQDDFGNIGDFPYFNFFADFKIKDFILFIRLENITEGMFGYNYYAAPNYPLPDFAFRFGGRWRFFN